MRGKLILFVLLLGIAGLVVGWRFAGESSFFDSHSIPASLRSFRELEDVPVHAGLTLPSEVRVALTNNPVSQVEFAVEGALHRKRRQCPLAVLQGSGTKSTLVMPLPTGFRVGRPPNHGHDARHRAGPFAAQSGSPTCNIEGACGSCGSGTKDRDSQRRAAGGLRRQRRRRRDARGVSRRGPAGAGHRRPVVRALSSFAARSSSPLLTSSLRRAARTMAAISTGAVTDAAMRPNRSRAGTRPIKRRASSVSVTGSLSARITRPFAGAEPSAALRSSTTRARHWPPVECPWCHDAELYRWTQELPLEEAAEPACSGSWCHRGNRSASGVDSPHDPHRRNSRADLRGRATAVGVTGVSAFDLRRQLNPAKRAQLPVRRQDCRRPLGARRSRSRSRRRPVPVGGPGPGRSRFRASGHPAALLSGRRSRPAALNRGPFPTRCTTMNLSRNVRGTDSPTRRAAGAGTRGRPRVRSVLPVQLRLISK